MSHLHTYAGHNHNMVTKTRDINTESGLGKCICVSFPLHEKGLIEDLDVLADQEFISRSQYIRKLIRKEKHHNKTSNNHLHWSEVVGNK